MGDQPTMPIPETPGASAPDATQVMPAVPEAAPPAQATTPPGPPTTPKPSSGDGDGRRRSMVLLVIIVVAILVVGACGAAYIIQKRRADDLEQRVTEAEGQVQDLMDEAGSETATPAADSDADADAGADADSDADADAGAETDADDDPAPASDDGRYIGLITDIFNVHQSRWIEIDYIQFLTGAEAADAAAARGDESPPPNDYYIVNENPMLREFNVRSGLAVVMWTWNIETDGVTEQSIPFDIWWDEIEMHGADHYLANPYWITIDNGTVIEIEEQYLP